MTFRSLYRLEQRGLLDCPIVGVAVDDWTRRRSCVERARDVDRGAPASRSTRRSSTASPRGSPTSQGDFADAATYERVAEAIKGAEPPVFYLEIPPFLFGTVVKGLADGGPDEERAGRRREAVRPRPRLGARARRRAAPVHRRVAALPDRPLPREDGPRGDPLPALREHDARAGLEPQLRRVRPDHDGRELRRRGPRPLLRPGRRAARRRRQPPDAGRRRRGDGAAVAAATRRRSRTRRSRSSASIVDGRPGALRARPVRRLPRRSTASRRTRRPRPTRRCGSRSRTGAGRACRSSSAPASACRSRRPSSGSSSSTRRGSASACATARPGAEPARRQARPVDRGPARSSTRTAPTPAGPAPIDARHGVRARRAARARRRTRCCCTRRWSATARASRARTASRRRWRIMQPLLDAPPPVAPLRAGLVGARGRPTSSSPATAAGTGPGSRT